MKQQQKSFSCPCEVKKTTKINRKLQFCLSEVIFILFEGKGCDYVFLQVLCVVSNIATQKKNTVHTLLSSSKMQPQTNSAANY